MMRLSLAGLALAAFIAPALADDGCMALANARGLHPELADGKQISPAQFWFLAGLFFSAPNTPAALPHGDKAIAVERGDELTIVIFLDQDMACEAVQLTGASLKAFKDAGALRFNHPGKGT